MKRIKIYMVEELPPTDNWKDNAWYSWTYGNRPERSEEIIEKMMHSNRDELYIGKKHVNI